MYALTFFVEIFFPNIKYMRNCLTENLKVFSSNFLTDATIATIYLWHISQLLNYLGLSVPYHYCRQT